MAKYRKKSLVIYAAQFTYPPTEDFLKFCGDSISNIRKNRHVNALAKADITPIDDENVVQRLYTITEGEFIIRGTYGVLYPCKPGIFENTYEPAYEVED